MEDEPAKPAIVIDNGTGKIKCGYAGNNEPSAVFASCVGYPRANTIGLRDFYVGDEARAKASQLVLKYPLEYGVVQDWEDMEKVWKHAFENELGVAVGGADYQAREDVHDTVLLAEGMCPTKTNREVTAQIMFETFRVRRFFVAHQMLLGLLATGRQTGLVLDCGDGVSHTVPIYGRVPATHLLDSAWRVSVLCSADGYTMPHAIQRINLAGRKLTDYMCKRLHQDSGIKLRTSAEREIANRIKESLCYIAPDYNQELLLFDTRPAPTGSIARQQRSVKLHAFAMATHPRLGATSPASQVKAPGVLAQIAAVVRSGGSVDFEMPDGSFVELGSELFRVPELLFDPSLDGLEMMGMHRIVAKSVLDCDFDVRQELLKNIVMVGGTTMFPGMHERLQAEVAQLTPEFPVGIVAPPERMLSAWIGGSILASLWSDRDEQWMNANSDPDRNPPITGYDEVGPRLVHQICNM